MNDNVIECVRCHDVMLRTQENGGFILYECHSCGYWLRQYIGEPEDIKGVKV